MSASTYVASRPGPFAALVQAADLGGLRLDPRPPVSVRDRFFDTHDGRLLRLGLALRVREAGGPPTAALLDVAGEAAFSRLPPEVELPGPVRDRLALPPSPLGRFVQDHLGDAPLRPLLSLRLYRTPRVAASGDRPVALVSFDVVGYEVPGAQVVSNEVEVEHVEGHRPPDAARLDGALRAHGLEPTARSMFERGVLRLPRRLSDPVLLLPDERRRLEEAAARREPLGRRRALVVLLDADGLRADAIAAQTGLSTARVRYWQQQFREARMDILPADAPDVLPPPAAGPGVREEPPEDPFASFVPPSGRPMPEEEAPPPAPEERPAPPPPAAPERPAYAGPSGDGASSPPPRPGINPPAGDPLAFDDVADLLDAFTPSDTSTPLLDAGSGDGPGDVPDESDEAPADPFASDPFAAEDFGDDGAADEDEGDGLFPTPAPPAPRPTGGPAAPPQPTYIFPVVLGPLAPEADPGPAADAPRLDAPEPEAPAAPVSAPFAERETREPEPPADESDRALLPAQDAPRAPAPALPRPALTGATPLLQAAQATVAYHVASFETAAERLEAGQSEADAQRVLIAAHRVRLALEAFRAVLPARAVERLLAALRLLAVDLDEVLDAGRAGRARLSTRAALADRQGRALASALGRLRGGRQQAWGDRARRLLARLAEQRADGVLLGDDFPAAPDDFVGEPGDVPAPTRLRHALASALWARYEAVRAFDDELGGEVDADTAYHLVLAVSGLHFVLGLAARASGGPVQELAAELTAAESALAAYRHARRTADLLAESGAPRTPPPDPAAVREVWARLEAPAFRDRLAAVAARI